MSDVALEDWVAVLWPQTGALRLFPSLSLAKIHVVPVDLAKYGYRSPVELQSRHDHRYLESLWTRLFEGAVLGWPRSAVGPLPEDSEAKPPDCSTELLSKELWSLMMRVGDRVQRATAAGGVRSKDHYRLDMAKINALCADAAGMRAYPKQCRVIVEALYYLDEPYVLEERLKKMMLELHSTGKLKSKQDSWLIFQFYRKRLIDDGLISRGEQDEPSD